MDPQDDSEDSGIFENAFQYILNTMSKEEMQALMSEDKVLEHHETKDDLSKAEEEALSEYLSIQKTETEEKEDRNTMGKMQEIEAEEDMEDQERIQQEQEYIETFLKEFPQVKLKLEEHITQLQALADKDDKLHRNCAISNIMFDTSGIVSNILTIVGIGLAPVTAGASLVVTATGLGLGIASGLGSVSTTIAEHSIRSHIKIRASRLTSSEIHTGEIAKEVLYDAAPKFISAGKSCVTGINDIKKNIQAIKLVQANPEIAAQASKLMKAGKVSIQGGEQMQSILEGTVLAMSKGARVLGVATASFSILICLTSLVQESVNLHKGSKTKSAENLRQQAQEWEKMLEELQGIYVSLLPSFPGPQRNTAQD
ncbi:apolipoprotein L2-like [Suncus etruscus]|uniref:apolipoprotein L2-like n=1 Tax=Suncus etruscus TaxID=109475 RepID=UPI00210F8621|nr:apolipoprotein L2-like [Suncus etruscus]